MKTILSWLAIMAIIVSCNDKTATASKDAGTDTSKMDYIYPVEHPDQWETGSKMNTQMAMEALKGFEENDIDKMMKNFGDTVRLQFDSLDVSYSKDSLKAFLNHGRSMYKSVKVIMDDFESVKSPHIKMEYVSFWYKQIWQDLKGVTDSIECMDDLGFAGGKIVLINEKVRHYPSKKM